MKVLWGLGKALTLMFWGLVLINLFKPLKQRMGSNRYETWSQTALRHKDQRFFT